jgi:dipeptidyl aminopeptidase/acylaminoacyl peptidase
MGTRARRVAVGVALGAVAAAATAVALATQLGSGGPGESEFAFDCAPPHPGRPATSLGDTLCIATNDRRRRIGTLTAIHRAGGAGSARWSPDGRRLLFRLELSQGTSQLDDIGMIDVDGSSYVDLTNFPEHGNWGAEWSPDGRRIVFNSGARLFVMNADGSGLKQITRIWGEYPAWSPDGKLIAFQSNRCSCNGPQGAEYDVYTVRPDGSGLHRLTSEPGEEGVSGWSPDGRFLAYGRDPDAHPGIWIIPRDGGRARRLLPKAPGVQLRGSEWASDGSFLMYAIPAGADPTAQTHTFIYRVSADGRQATKLLDDAGGADLRPSGKGRALTHLTLTHRWLSRSELELSGQLTIGGTPKAGRKIALGRLGKTLPTHRLRTIVTGRDGRFRFVAHVAHRRSWRVATAFYRGSGSEWSTTAFDGLSS